MVYFKDRFEAGEKLAEKLTHIEKPFTVLAIPRGGVQTAYPIAKRFGLKLQLIVSRKISLPENRELGIGAVSEKGTVIFNRSLISQLQVPDTLVGEALAQQQDELKKRIEIYRQGKSLNNLSDKNICLIDDGLAEGMTAKAAILALIKFRVRKIFLIIPICPEQIASDITDLAEVIYLHKVRPPFAISQFYKDFHQISDKEVLSLLG